MALLREDPDHLSYLATEFRRLASRTDQARVTAIGFSDFGSGNAHDPSLDEGIDWFYRRWVQRVETACNVMLDAADALDGASWLYQETDERVGAATDPPPRRVGADL